MNTRYSELRAADGTLECWLRLCLLTVVAVTAPACLQEDRRDPARTRSTAPSSAKKLPSSRSARQPDRQQATVSQRARSRPRQLPTIRTPELQARDDAGRSQLDPEHNRWQSEAFAAHAETLLRALVAGGMSPSPPSGDKFQQMLSSDFACTNLRAQQLVQVFKGSNILVQRGDPRRLSRATPKLRGADVISRAFSELRLDSAPEISIRINSVAARKEMAMTQSQVIIRGSRRKRRVQIRATWDCLWELATVDRPRLSAIRLRDYEEGEGDGRPWFTDCTASVLDRNRSVPQQLAFGTDHWLERIDRGHGMHIFSVHGLAIGDVSGDGLDDLYVCQPGGLPNRLFLQNADGTATDYSVLSRANILDRTSCALLVDLDNDGDQDLILGTGSGIALMAGNDEGRFRWKQRLTKGKGEIQSLSAADYDNDGDLDIYACMSAVDWPLSAVAGSEPWRAPDQGPANQLFRNETESEDWRFQDVTQSTGLDVNNRHHSLTAAWEDFDRDGDQDLCVANVDGENCLYRNDNGQFTEVAEAVGLADAGAGVSVNWADFNRDGRPDVFVGAIYISAGGRLAALPTFSSRAGPSMQPRLRRIMEGSALYQNRGDVFRGFAAQAVLQRSGWASGSLGVDVDNNGWEDIVATRGFITGQRSPDLKGLLWSRAGSRSPQDGLTQIKDRLREGYSLAAAERNMCFLNVTGRGFADVSMMSGLDQIDSACAVVQVDWDQDGDLDVWMTSRSGPQVRFLRNDVPNSHHFLAVRLEGRASNRDAVGARLDLSLQGVPSALTRTVRAGGVYLGQSSKWIHFGLGSAARIEKLVVHWPAGSTQEFRGLDVDHSYHLVEGSGRAEPYQRPTVPLALQAGSVLEPPSSPVARVLLGQSVAVPELDLPSDAGRVNATDKERSALLLTLWDPDVPDSIDQIRRLANHQDTWQAVDAEIIALSTDGSVELHATESRKTVGDSSTTSPSVRTVRASTVLLDQLQSLHDQCFERHVRIPIPSSFLIDRSGQLACIYRGPVEVDILAADIAKIDLDSAQRRQASVPFSGRWVMEHSN